MKEKIRKRVKNIWKRKRFWKKKREKELKICEREKRKNAKNSRKCKREKRFWKKKREKELKISEREKRFWKNKREKELKMCKRKKEVEMFEKNEGKKKKKIVKRSYPYIYFFRFFDIIYIMIIFDYYVFWLQMYCIFHCDNDLIDNCSMSVLYFWIISIDM